MRTTADLAKKWAAPAIALVMGAATGCVAPHVRQPHMRAGMELSRTH